jgi:protein-L-isoaspartate(D-aspartate) O-methyltransferase
MLEQLRLAPGMRVLEIGAGAGYNAALLAELVGPMGSVTSIELDRGLASEAAAHLANVGYSSARARVIAGDGWEGAETGAPWDRIEATVGVWDISPAWVDQLAEDGLLLVPLWLGVTDVSVALRKRGNELISESWALCGFVRLRGAGALQAQTSHLSNRRALSGPGAEEAAPQVARLLDRPARRSHWCSPGPGFIPTLALFSGGLLTLWQTGPAGLGRPSGRYALYREGDDGPSLALLSERNATLLTFGGGAAERYIREQTEAFATRTRLDPSSWSLTVRPAATTLPAAPGAIRQRTPHWVYDMRVTSMEECGDTLSVNMEGFGERQRGSM